VRFRAYAIPDAGENTAQLIAKWREAWSTDLGAFVDRGCGCCVHILEFDASEEAIADLERRSGWTFERTQEGVKRK
jgi:hypothetical protein